MDRGRKGTILLVLFIFPGFLKAGLYNPAEPREGLLNPNYRIFKKTLEALRSIGPPRVLQETPLRMRYFLVTESAPRSVAAGWPLSQRLSLTAYMIRRGKTSEAIGMLRELARRQDNNFLVLSNMATAHQLESDPRTAAEYLSQAIEAWPRDWKGLDKNMASFLKEIGWEENRIESNRDPLRWYREAETYHLKLLRLRAREKKTDIPEKFDDLFEVRFVGESGNYEAGKLADKGKARLPANALLIVQQLLVWLPDDWRLFWLLGELYNARGEPETALEILDSPQLGGLSGLHHPEELKNHLNVLRAAPPPSITPGQTNPDIAPPPPAENSPRIDLRALGVGFLAGVVVSFLTYWQFREILRRRQSRGNEATRNP